MAISVEQFWSLAVESGLLSPKRRRELADRFAQVRGAERANAVTLAAWLVDAGALTRYQAKLLSAGRSGPLRFGPYRVAERIADGRLAKLLRGEHSRTGERVILYPLGGPASEDPHHWQRIVAQARRAATVADRHVARVLAIVERPGEQCLVLEDLAGQSLAERLERGPLSEQSVLALAHELSLGLAALHGAGMAHADLSPQNVWLAEDGTARLLAFPLSRGPLTSAAIAVDPARPSPRLAAMAECLAPELTARTGQPTVQSDLYSLGCVLYWATTGQPPFGGGTLPDKLRRHASQPPAALPPGTPAALAVTVARLLVKQPGGRLADAKAVLQSLGGTAPLAAAAPPACPIVVEPASSAPAAIEIAPVVIATAPSPVVAPRETPLAVATDGCAASPLVAHRRRRNANLWALGASGLLVAGLAVAAIVAMRDKGSNLASQPVGGTLAGASSAAPATSAPPAASSETPPSPTDTPAKAATVAARSSRPLERSQPEVVLVGDDQETLWTSPTASEPLSLELVPPGGQLFVALRPAEVLSHAEGPKLLDALGPGGAAARQAVESATGASLAEIAELLVTLSPQDTGPPLVAYRVTLSADLATSELLKRWGHPRPTKAAGKDYYERGETAYLPGGDSPTRFAVLPAAQAAEVLAASGPPPLRPDMEKLLRSTDRARHATLLAAPNAVLLSSGKGLFVGQLDKLRAPLAQWLGDDLQAASLSFHLGNEFFAELRAIGRLEQNALALARRFRTDLGKVPQSVEDYVVALNPRPYGRKVLFRYPNMIRLLQEYTRVGQEGQQAVLRAYLPAEAAHNLLLGTELALAEQPGGNSAAAATSAEPKPPATVAEALTKRISLVFERDTFQRAVDLVGQELGVEVEIVGKDVELDGITKNKSFGLEERDKPASEVLKAILQKADPAGRLVYVIKPRPAGGKEMIFFTTRSAAEKRGEKLPPDLAAAAPTKKQP